MEVLELVLAISMVDRRAVVRAKVVPTESLTGTLKPQTLVIVKELVYEVRENADYNLVLTVSDKANIPFTSAKDGENGLVELKKLIENGKITSRAIEHVGKTVNMNFVGSCTYRSSLYYSKW